MLQVQLAFPGMTNQTCHGEYLSSGCFGKAWRTPDGNAVKQARCHDGTLAWIYWCKGMQDAGHLMPGMPVIYKLALTTNGWIAVMEYVPEACRDGDPGHEAYKALALPDKYKSWGLCSLADMDPDGPYYATMAAFELAWNRAGFGNETALGDLHSGNVRMRENGSLVILDPSAMDIDPADLHKMFGDDEEFLLN